MDLKEILEKAGVKNVDQILADMEANKIFTASEENMDLRYGKLKEQFDGKDKELVEAQKLIAELKKAGAGNEDLQKKITEYETKVTDLQKQLEASKLESAIKVALLEAKATDVDYLMFKLGKDGLSVGEDGKVKGLDSKLEELKKQFPNQFDSGHPPKVKENRLPDDDKTPPAITKEQFDKMGYQDRLKLMNDNPDEYRKLAGKGE